MRDPNKVCFIISHKYFRGYTSYIKYYADNIKKLYPDSLTIIVDNNSVYKDDVLKELEGLEGVIILDNDIDSKFEIGAYTVGLNYLITNHLHDQYSHIVCSQDNFVLKNRYDFETMVKDNCYARPINSMFADGECRNIVIPVMNMLGLNDNWDKVNFCWCSSFAINSEKASQLFEYFNKIRVTCRWESCAGERYLARILWELNEHKDCGDIDGSCSDLAVRHYDTWNVNVFAPSTSFFVKQVQQKNERTVDSDAPQHITFKHRDQLEQDYNKTK